MKIAFVAVLLALFVYNGNTSDIPSIPENDRIRIAEVFRLSNELNGKIWKDWKEDPFSILLVTPEYEFLIKHANPTDDFKNLGRDDLLNTDIFYRQRTQSTNFLATFPLIAPEPTIVIGQAENTTSKTSTRWLITLLHEHFHQLQMSQPHYYDEVNALDLAGGDQTGMWMLNYPFPYDSPDVAGRIEKLAALLHAALLGGKSDLYFKQRAELQKVLVEKDYRYLAFQFWQEGIARYTEYRIAKWAAEEYEPQTAFRNLPDFVSFRDVASEIFEQNILKRLKNADLSRDRRELFYPLGAGEALLQDHLNPQWRDHYWDQLSTLVPLTNSN